MTEILKKDIFPAVFQALNFQIILIHLQEKNLILMNSKNKVILYSIVLGLILYILDSLIDYLIFAEDLKFFQVLITQVPLFEVYNRLFMVLGVILFGFIISSWISDINFENDFLKNQVRSIKQSRRDAEFIDNLSYQIRTPLNAIVGFSDLLKDPNLSAQSKTTYINHIHSSGNYLLQLVNNMVDISRFDEDEMLLDLKDCNVNELLDDLQIYFNGKKEELNKKNIQLQIEKGVEGYDFVISTDTERFKQVLINLLENAFKHTDEGIVKMGYWIKEEDLLEFYVKDTGKGFSEDRLAVIFDRYKKLTDNKNQPFDGTALRLSIVKSMVKLLGGNIWAHSKRGEGASFYFTLPFISLEKDQIAELKSIEEEKEALKYSQKTSGWSDKLILIAEDVESNFIYLQELLRPTGLHLIWAENGKIAVDKVKEIPAINLVLLDILMPEMDGYEAAMQIKNLRPDLPIIAQTAYSLDASKKDKKNLKNFDNYLIKPIWSPQLFEAISKYLGERELS